MGLATIIILGIALVVYLYAVIFKSSKGRGELAGVLSIFLALIGGVLGLGYAGERLILTASTEQKHSLAQRLADCPDVRVRARQTIDESLSLAMANDLITACANEHLRRSANR